MTPVSLALSSMTFTATKSQPKSICNDTLVRRRKKESTEHKEIPSSYSIFYGVIYSLMTISTTLGTVLLETSLASIPLVYIYIYTLLTLEIFHTLHAFRSLCIVGE